MELKRICVYCGSSDAVPETYLAAARGMGTAMAARDLTLIFGGGRTGLMGAVADTILQAGASAIGVIPEHFNTPSLAHAGLTELRVVRSMHERKALMAELADAFVALPGGYGTFEELFEILTWAQIGLHRRPIGVLNVEGYFDPMLELLSHAQEQGFLYAEHRRLLHSERSPEELLDRLANCDPP